jgi:hypothetical protein
MIQPPPPAPALSRVAAHHLHERAGSPPALENAARLRPMTSPTYSVAFSIRTTTLERAVNSVDGPMSRREDLRARWRRFKLALAALLPAVILMWILPGGSVVTSLVIFFVWAFFAAIAWRSLTDFRCPRCSHQYFGQRGNILAGCCEHCLKPLPAPTAPMGM